MILLSRGKNGQESNIPITKDLKQVIEKLKFYGGDRLFPFPIFVNHLNYKEKNNRLYDRSYANYRNFLSRMAKKLRWKKNVKSHTLRHTFAMVMLNKYKMSWDSVSSMMGHTDIKTTQQNYAYVSQERVADEFKENVG